MQLRVLSNSSSSSTSNPNLQIKVWEFPATQTKSDKQHKRGTLYTISGDNRQAPWTQMATDKKQKPVSLKDRSNHVISVFLPAQYPDSVAPGYLRFASFCFTASVAGSAAMVLSTQTLLLAVGVVGSNVHHAGIMAGALNWVMKDGIGQFGGVLFASQMGKTRTFDSDPKRWRMVSAIALDCATLLEILSPLFYSSLVLPVACIANIGKNIGFLTASASRAAIHQTLAITGNLGDVTAKAASQSMVAGLVGTTLGIGLSSLLSHDVYNFSLGFGVLALIHQGCNYASLKSVPLYHLNRHRLHLVLEEYLRDIRGQKRQVPIPTQVSTQEVYLPFIAADDSKTWLSIGSPLQEVCPVPSDLDELLKTFSKESYILRRGAAGQDQKMHLVFLKDAQGQDLIRGMFHAYLLRQLMQKDPSGDANNIDKLAYSEVEEIFPRFYDELQGNGWKTDTELTTVEGSKARRLEIEHPYAQHREYHKEEWI